jgi:pilus assembly protein FimV
VASSLALLGAVPPAQAAGLGRLVVFSALGQPLRAEIEVTATPQELTDLKAQLASPETFRQAGLEYATALMNVRFDLDRRPNGQMIVRLHSDRPINDPFIDLLLELTWSSGRLVREYTFLLDPPEYASRTTAPSATVPPTVDVPSVPPATNARAVLGLPAPELAPSPQTAVSSISTDIRSSGTPSVIDDGLRARAIAQVQGTPQKPVAVETAAPAIPKERHEVRRGDTLHRIATETKLKDISLDQMLVGLFRANPGAFDGSNMNRLRTGAILSIPQRSALESVSTQEARKIVLAQSANWNAYRSRLAGAAGRSASEDGAAGRESAGRITARVADEAERAAPKDQLKVAKAEPASGRSGTGAGTVRVPEEDLIARDRALEEANERIALLEKNVADLKKLLELKDQNLAELQQQASGGQPAAPESASLPPTAPQAPTAARQPAPLPPLPDEPGIIDFLFDDMALLAGGGLAVLALVGGGFYWRRRRASANAETPEPSLSRTSESLAGLTDNSVFRNTTGGQSIDTSSRAQSDFSQVGPGSIDTDEVDPVAEADVYMAYGRDAQAEEILLEARQKDPKRAAIAVKLLEVYFQRKDVKQFEMLAVELYGETGGTGADWDKAAAMGRALDPGNPVFRGTSTGVVAGTVKTGAENGDPAIAPAPAVTKALPSETAARENHAAPDDAALQADAFTLASNTESAVEAPPPEEPKAPAPAKVEQPDLDFDIGTQVAPLAGTPDSQDGKAQRTDLDFDLGAATQPPPDYDETGDDPPTVVPANEQALADDAVEFDVNLTESTFLGRPPPEPPPFDMKSIDLDLHAPEPEAAEPENPAARIEEYVPEETRVSTVVNPNFASPQMETVQEETAPASLPDFPEPPAAPSDDAAQAIQEVPVAQTDAAFDFDFAGQQVSAAASSPSAARPEPEELALEEPDVGGSEEVTTKLDLAKAYEEMGDAEGARELLQEVLKEGNVTQREEAQAMLDRIDG